LHEYMFKNPRLTITDSTLVGCLEFIIHEFISLHEFVFSINKL
jgi:hypothetical protein